MTSYINDRGKIPTVGTVTSVAETFTGGIISVAGSPVTTSGTFSLTVAGTSGGIPYFSSGTAWATSAALAASAIMLGGGAGAAPATTATGTGVVTALGVNVGSAGAFVTFNGAGGTPSSMTATNLTGTATGLIAGYTSLLSTGGAATAGELTLVTGTKTVNTTAATSTCLIFFQRKTAGGTIGFATTYTINAGTSFTVSSDSALDTSVYAWRIIETR